jgi:hypothetical protein
MRAAIAFVAGIAIGLTSAMAQTPNAAPEGMVLARTESGCQIYRLVPFQPPAARGLAEIKHIAKWEGDCVKGFAQGLGNLVTSYESGTFKSESIVRQRVHLGVPFGYGTSIFDTKTGGPNSRFLSWIFTWKNQTLGFRGLGLAGDPAMLDGDKVERPIETMSAVRDVGTLNTELRSLQFRKTHCGQFAKRVAQFQNCTYGQTDADVYAFFDIPKTAGTIQERMAAAKYDFCPNPKSFEGCAEFAYQLAAPARKEIIAFIEANRAEVEATIREMNAVKR